MTIPAKIDGPGLTEKQARYVEELLSGKPHSEALMLAGYAETTDARMVRGSKAVQDAIAAACEAKMRDELRPLALKAIEELATSGPAATRLQAAKLILEHTQVDQQGAKKPLAKMTEEELQAVVEDAARKAMQLQAIDVEPKTGA